MLLYGSGAERARSIANTMGNSLQWWTGVGTLSWDYVTNYFFSQSTSRGMGVAQAMGHLSDLSSIVQELTQLGSDNERLQWLARNYSRAFAVAKSSLGNLLTIFDSDVSSTSSFSPYLLSYSSFHITLLYLKPPTFACGLLEELPENLWNV